VRLHLRGGLRALGVETIPVCNFEPHILSRRTVGGLSLVTIEGQQRTPSGLRFWQHEVPERLLQSPLGLHRALSGAMGATGIIWASQAGHLARFLSAELQVLVGGADAHSH
jgi:hypothetical protein